MRITELWRLASQDPPRPGSPTILTCLVFSAAHDSSPSIPPVLYQKLFMIWSIMALLPCLVCCDKLETAENEELLPLTGVTHCRRGMVFLMVTGSPEDGKNSRNVQTINSDPLLVPQASNSPQGQPKGGVSLHSSPVLFYKHSVVPGYMNQGKTLMRKQRQWLLDGHW